MVYILLKSLLLSSLTLSSALMVNKTNDQPSILAQDKEVVTLGGGCFWCIEAFFDELEGVVRAESGYSGGWVDNPTYQGSVRELRGMRRWYKLRLIPRSSA